MDILEKYLQDPVFYNGRYQQENGDEEAIGDACWDLHDTMLYLFSNSEETNDTYLCSYELDAAPQVHFVIKLGEKVYEMLDGSVYIRNYVNDDILLRNSLMLLKKSDRGIKTIKIISKKSYELSNDLEIEEKFNTLTNN